MFIKGYGFVVLMKKPLSKILAALRKRQGVTMLEEFRGKYTPFQVLVSTVLSARAKDSTTIPLVKELFRKYRTPDDFVRVPIRTLEKAIFKSGFYKTKAKHIKALSKMILNDYGGKVPSDMGKLVALPGVGRKTANCVLVYAFGKPSIPVDVHVHRISNRIGLVDTKTPEKTEVALASLVPKRNWMEINELLVTHGQTICSSRNPGCGECPVNKWCDYNLKK
jgi:endonuclease III